MNKEEELRLILEDMLDLVRAKSDPVREHVAADDLLVDTITVLMNFDQDKSIQEHLRTIIEIYGKVSIRL